MRTELFYKDNENFFALDELRACARREVENSPLIQRAASGDKDAAVALHIGFWPFVHEFELAIDDKVRKMPRELLDQKFGKLLTRKVFVSITRAVREMKAEEGQHSAHWRKDAECLGVTTLDGPRITGVQALIKSAYTEDLPQFFSVLAGTEYIAEELSDFLIGSEKYTNLFSRKRWVWGEVHTIPHDDGPSHLEIDLDLARAYNLYGIAEGIESMIAGTINLFGKAATDVEHELLVTA